MSTKILLLLFILTVNAPAMDRWSALAMIESGDDDHIIGRAGEISRYQIRRDLWPGGNPSNPCVALANARQIMSLRVAAFEQAHGRVPDDFEFYILWNAPAQINHPSRAVAERAWRFINLVDLVVPDTRAPSLINGGRMEVNKLIRPGEPLKNTQVPDFGHCKSPTIPSQLADLHKLEPPPAKN